MGIKKAVYLILMIFCTGGFAAGQSDTSKTYEWQGRTIRYYKVEKGKTLYSISKEFGIPQDSIISINPEALKGMKAGMVLKIPWGFAKTTKPPEGALKYTVKPKETLYSISQTYGLTVEELTAMNPKVKDGLKEGMILNIYPKSGKKLPANPSLKEPVDTAALVSPVEPEPKKGLAGIFKGSGCKPVDLKDSKEELTIALMLPFYISASEEYNPKSKIGLDFFSGAKMAFDSLERLGLHLKVNVYDTQADSATIASILKVPDFMKNELIIGPLYSSDFHLVAEFSDRTKIPAVSPFSQSDILIEKHPQVIKVSPDNQTMVTEICRHLATKEKNAFFTLIRNANAKDKDLADIMLATLLENGVPATRIKDLTYSGVSEILEGLDSGFENYLLFPSTVQIQVIDVISRLSASSLGKRITLIGLNDWNNFENIDYEHLNNLNFTYAVPYQSDFVSAASQSFSKQFREEYKGEPSNYAFQGFDVTMYSVGMLARYGKTFTNCLDQLPAQCGINSCYMFRKDSPENGLENNFVNIMQLDDFKAKRINNP